MTHAFPQLIPVLDLMQGQVVRGIAGRRDEYRPMESLLVEGADPLATAEAIRRTFDVDRLYVADLDAIRFGALQEDILGTLARGKFLLCVDAGIEQLDQAGRLLAMGVERVVAGLETLPALDLLSDLIREFGPDRITFSLDLMQGRPLGKAGDGLSPLEIVAEGVGMGVRHVIVLDLVGVGMGRGIPRLDLCREILAAHSGLTLWTGGGVRSIGDLEEAGDIGIQGVLVASAVHDGRISGEAWRAARG